MNLGSASQSKIDPNEGDDCTSCKASEEDRFYPGGASPNSQNLSDRGVIDNSKCFSIPETDWVCVIGVSFDYYESIRSHLDGKRRLVFLDIEGKNGSFDHRQVSVLAATSALHLAAAAKKIGWKSVFQTAAVVFLKPDDKEIAIRFEESLIRYKEGAHLLLSDWADSGESVLQNAFSHWNRLPEVKSGLELKDRFQDIPAIICGAGPSLKKNARYLDPDKALIFAGGAALNQLPIEPHFAASIDRQAPHDFFKKHSFWQVPMFYQSRMNPQNFSLLHGEKLYIPDGCYPAESWLSGSELFDGGWTVGTFLISLAVHLGCNPIIWIGMDLCYEDEKKYAFSDNLINQASLVAAKNSLGQKVWSQRDWLMAAQWMGDLAAQRWDRMFINATEGGLPLSGPIDAKPLREILKDLPSCSDLAGRVHAEISSLPSMDIPLERMNQWKSSLKRCLTLCKKGKKRKSLLNWEDEIVYQQLLFPLWQIWSPLFERELELDDQPINLEEKLRLNQILFFERVLHEQTDRA